MPMFRSAKYRLYPSKGQARTMDQILERCRLVYNEEVEMCRKAYEADGRFPSRESIQDYCDYVLKLDDPGLDEVCPCCLEDVSRRVSRAFGKFRSMLGGGTEPKLPSSKGPDRYTSFTYPRCKGSVSIREGGAWFQGIGTVKCIMHRPIEGAPVSCTLSRSPVGKWYATVSFITNIASESSPSTDGKGPVGIDLGLYNLAVFSDGTVFDNKKLYESMMGEMKGIQKKMERFSPDSPDHERYRRRLDHLFEHYNNRMSDEMHKRSKDVVEAYSMIALEDLRVEKMIRGYRTREGRRSQSTAAWRTFVEMIEYKAARAGVDVVFVNPRGTSQMCSGCGLYVPKGVGVRMHECPQCGLRMDRDLNAAKNILRIGLGMQASVPGNRNSRIPI